MLVIIAWITIMGDGVRHGFSLKLKFDWNKLLGVTRADLVTKILSSSWIVRSLLLNRLSWASVFSTISVIFPSSTNSFEENLAPFEEGRFRIGIDVEDVELFVILLSLLVPSDGSQTFHGSIQYVFHHTWYQQSYQYRFGAELLRSHLSVLETWRFM